MKKKYTPTLTAKEVKEIGTIVYDVFDEGIRFIIKKSSWHWCGYIGIPLDHPLAGFNYEDLDFISAHGGLTFASSGSDKWPEGYYWYGWDYGHAGDYCHYDIKIDNMIESEKDWTIKEVIEDSRDTLYEFKKLIRLAEKIVIK